MKINKKAFKLVGVTEQQYIDWCKLKNLPINSKDSMSDFFRRIREGRLVEDFFGNLKTKRRSKTWNR